MSTQPDSTPPPHARPPGETPLLVVSNRLPVTLSRSGGRLRRRRSMGGLVSALTPMLERRGGTWLGWPGLRLAPDEAGVLNAPDDRYRMRAVDLTSTDVNRYYHGFSNGTLWPLFHAFPERALFDRRNWETYERVNARFAEHALDAADPGDLLWIHDYHLARCPHFVRQERPDARIGYFLHIPFPPHDVFRLLPWGEELLHGLLASDLVGFQVPGYARNFTDCVERLLAARVDHERGLIEHGPRTVQVGAFPIGIDFEAYESRALDAAAGPQDGMRVLLGVDRLDYTKGIPERIRAVERLLERHREHRGRVVLLQVAVPSRAQVAEYRELKREIDELVGRVNGRFATAQWSPIQYLYRSLAPERLAQLYRDADVALVTPLRDGMNLVAKEFVAARVAEPGVLVLSRLAGAAETMREAVLVNPFDVDGTAEAVHRALTMQEAERRSRMVALRRRERRDSVDAWGAQFLAAAAAGGALDPASERDFDAWLGRMLARYHLALFLDYDGTLTPIQRRPEHAQLDPAMRRALIACQARPDTDVTLVSGRALADVKALVGVPGLTYAGNHGLEIDGPDLAAFRHPDLGHYARRLEPLALDVRKACDVPGAWVEEKGASLTLHYREVDGELHERVAANARRVIQAAGFQARDAHCAIEARPPIGWDKGHAVLHVLRERHGPAWSENVRAIYAGDDRTDEDAFRVLGGLGMTFRVGPADGATAADRRLVDVNAIHALLVYVAQR